MTIENTTQLREPAMQASVIEHELQKKCAPIERKILESLTSPEKFFDGELDISALNAIFENLTYTILIEEQNSLKILAKAATMMVFRVASETRFEQYREKNVKGVKQRLVVGNYVEIVHPKNKNFRSFTVYFSFVEDTASCNLKLENNEINVDVDGGLLEKLSRGAIGGKVRKRVTNPCFTIQQTLTHRLKEFYGYKGKIKDIGLDLSKPNKLHTVITAGK